MPWWLLLLLGWLGQVGLRVLLAAGQTVPVATPDETGYLFAARVLAGGPDADISYSTAYRGGYSLLLVPAFSLSDDPETVYRLAIVITALVSAALLLLAYVLFRRLELPRMRSYVFAHVTALLPASVFYSQYALTDAVLPVLVLGWLLLTHSWLTARDISSAKVTAYGIAAGLVAAYAYAVHVRGIFIVVVHVGVLACAVAWRWRSVRSAGLALAALLAGVAAGRVLNRWLEPHLWPDGSYDMQRTLVRQLSSADGYGWILSGGIGQIWYQIVATGGVAGIGLIAMIAVAVRRGWPPQLRVLAAGLIVVLAGVAFATMAALPDEHRVGNYAYSRYLACFTPVLFAVGLVTVLRSTVRTVLRAAAVVAVVTLAMASVIQTYAGSKLETYTHLPFDFPETGFLTWSWTEFRLWPVTLAGLALFCLLLGLSRVPRYGMALVAGALVIVNLAAVTSATFRISRPLVRETTAMADLTGAINSRTRIAMDVNIPWKIRLPQLYQASRTEVRGFDSTREPPPADADLVVIAWGNWGKGTPAASTWPGRPPGWRIALSRRSAEGDWVAWRRT